MGLAGSGISFLGSLLQKKPEIPAYVPVDPAAEAAKATAGNTANLQGAENLASSVDSFNQGQMLAELRKAIPGYDSIASSAGSDIASFLKGQIPQDVSDLVNRSTAARAVSGGFGGTGLANNLTARDLGTTSVGLIGQGLDAASRWLQSQKNLTMPQNFDVSSMFISPAQQIANTRQNNTGAFQQAYATNLNNAAYDPSTLAGTALMQYGQSLEGMGASSAGGAAGGGGASAPAAKTGPAPGSYATGGPGGGGFGSVSF